MQGTVETAGLMGIRAKPAFTEVYRADVAGYINVYFTVCVSGANDLEGDRVLDAEGTSGLSGPVAQHGVGFGSRVFEVQAMLLQRRHPTVDEAGHVDRVGRLG